MWWKIHSASFFFFFIVVFFFLAFGLVGLLRVCQTHGIQMHGNGVLGFGGWRLMSAGRAYSGVDVLGLSVGDTLPTLLYLGLGTTSLLDCNNASLLFCLTLSTCPLLASFSLFETCEWVSVTYDHIHKRARLVFCG